MSYVRYRIYLWTPPLLTPEQQVEAGRQIVANGGADEWKKKAPYLPPEEQAAVANARRNPNALQKALLIALAAGAVLAVAAFVPGAAIALGVVAITIVPIGVGSLIHSKNRYQKWVDEMVEVYLRDLENKLRLPPDVIAELHSIRRPS
jgi:hypothetical protein